jgi:hypothetical protein
MAPPGDDHKVPLGAVSSCNRIGCDILAAVDAINMDYEPLLDRPIRASIDGLGPRLCVISGLRPAVWET